MSNFLLTTVKSCLMLLLLLSFAVGSQAQSAFWQVHDETPIELSGFSLSEAYEIPDDEPLNLDQPILKQLLYRIKRTSPDSRHTYSKFSESITWADINEKTADHRLWIFDRTVRLKKIEKHRFKNLSPDEEIKGVFVCHCETIEDRIPFLALTRSAPRQLTIDTPLDERVQVIGFLYSRISGLSSEDKREMPVFIADRLAWFPQQVSGAVTAAQIRLAEHGFDVGQLDLVHKNNTRPLNSQDAEAYFQFLAAVSHMDVAIDKSVQPKLGFTDLMQHANANFGETVRVKGMVRTCSEIPIPYEEISNRLGISKYYQLMLFPDLDGAKIVVNTKDGQQLDYRRFPVTICCTELPVGMTPKEMERKPFEVEGYFFRFWKYQSEKTSNAEASGQVSPLIITKRPIAITPSKNMLDSILFVFVISIIAGIAALLIGYRYMDSKRRTPGAEILASLPEQIDLSGLEE